MAFASVPWESKGHIDRAWDIISERDLATRSDASFNKALELADRWRACHAHPINTFKATLRNYTRDFVGAFVAQRLKRMPTIIDKLRRYPKMSLSRMQDIWWVRAVVDNIEDVYKLAEKYREKSRFAHELIRERDYIQNPKNDPLKEDGYRSLHLIFKYKNKRNSAYDGLSVEVQIRTRLQHIWATAVETMGTFLWQALKSRKGDKDWLEFFALVSSVFAFKEKTPLLERHKKMSQTVIRNKIIALEKKLGVMEKMSGLSYATEQINNSGGGQKSFYHLIVLYSGTSTVAISAYDRNGLRHALTDYAKYEALAIKGERIEPVLVSAGPIKTLRRAYPNFFLDIREFIEELKTIVDPVEISKEN